MKRITLQLTGLAVALLLGTGCGTSSDAQPTEAADLQKESDLGRLLPAAKEADATCAEAHAWARANADQLPTTYDGLAGYSMTYRKAIFENMNADQRRAAWGEQLQRELTRNTRPTLAQQEIFRRAFELAAQMDQATEPKVSELSRAATAAFGAAEAERIFGTLGPSEQAVASAARYPTCNCSTTNDWCGGRCRGNSCYWTDAGCGFLWLVACRGICR